MTAKRPYRVHSWASNGGRRDWGGSHQGGFASRANAEAKAERLMQENTIVGYPSQVEVFYEPGDGTMRSALQLRRVNGEVVRERSDLE